VIRGVVCIFRESNQMHWSGRFLVLLSAAVLIILGLSFVLQFGSLNRDFSVSRKLSRSAPRFSTWLRPDLFFPSTSLVFFSLCVVLVACLSQILPILPIQEILNKMLNFYDHSCYPIRLIFHWRSDSIFVESPVAISPFLSPIQPLHWYFRSLYDIYQIFL
jgi:hypothetical protein